MKEKKFKAEDVYPGHSIHDLMNLFSQESDMDNRIEIVKAVMNRFEALESEIERLKEENWKLAVSAGAYSIKAEKAEAERDKLKEKLNEAQREWGTMATSAADLSIELDKLKAEIAKLREGPSDVEIENIFDEIFRNYRDSGDYCFPEINACIATVREILKEKTT